MLFFHQKVPFNAEAPLLIKKQFFEDHPNVRYTRCIVLKLYEWHAS